MAVARRPAGAIAVAIACAGLSGLSLVLPYSLSSDEWSWLIWGREVRQLDLQLAGGTLWKPLPVLFTIFVSAFGDAAPYLWLALVRMGWLLALIAGFRVGARLGGRAAGALSALALLLIPAHAEWLAYFGRGSAEPLVAALALWAVDRHLNGRRLQALALVSLAAMGRPEAWPLAIGYAAIIWGAEGKQERAVVLALLATTPALWLGVGWWGTGGELPDPLSSFAAAGGRERDLLSVLAAAGATGTLAGTALFVGPMVVAPVWVAGAFAFLRALPASRDGGDEAGRVTVALGVAAVVWTLTVIGWKWLGIPPPSRFLFGPAALISILGGLGMAGAVRAVSPRRRTALVATIAAVTLPFAVVRAAELATWLPRGSWAPFAEPAWAEVLRRAGAADRLAACGDEVRVRQATEGFDSRARAGKFGRSEIAWRLGARLAWVDRLSVRRAPNVERALVLVPAGLPRVPPRGSLVTGVSDATRPGRWRRVAVARGWAVYEVGCRGR